MQRFSINLYTRILFWLTVNVCVLLLGCWWVLQWQFKEGFQGALGGIVGDRLQSIGREMHARLSRAERPEWEVILKQFAEEHGLRTGLITVPARQVMGSLPELPDEVIRLVQDMIPEAGRHPPGGRPPPPPRHEDSAIENFLFGEVPFFGGEPPPEPPDEFDSQSASLPVKLGTFMLQAGEPPLYYTGIRLPRLSQWPRPNGPLLLVFVTPSLTGGGLFFNTRPWLLGLLAALALSALLWLPFVRSITKSIRETMQVTEQVARGRFDSRVIVDRTDEIGRLAQAVNQMAAQLDGTVRGQKRFLGDIAHELCSPMARMEMSFGILEERLTNEDALRLADAREELRQMSGMVHELLSFSKSTLHTPTQTSSTVPLLSLLDEAATTEAIPARLLRIQVPPDLQVRCIPDLLRRALANLLRNAMLHAPGSLIEVSAQPLSAESLRLILRDHGPGVPAECVSRLFDPFFRVDTSRDRQTGGSGLGLAIVKTCVDACGGTVTARNAIPGGLEIEMELPRA